VAPKLAAVWNVPSPLPNSTLTELAKLAVTKSNLPSPLTSPPPRTPDGVDAESAGALERAVAVAQQYANCGVADTVVGDDQSACHRVDVNHGHRVGSRPGR